MMASYVPSGASCTNLMPSVMCTFTRGSLKPSAISGKNFLEVSGTILHNRCGPGRWLAPYISLSLWESPLGCSTGSRKTLTVQILYWYH